MRQNSSSRICVGKPSLILTQSKISFFRGLEDYGIQFAKYARHAEKYTDTPHRTAIAAPANSVVVFARRKHAKQLADEHRQTWSTLVAFLPTRSSLLLLLIRHCKMAAHVEPAVIHSMISESFNSQLTRQPEQEIFAILAHFLLRVSDGYTAKLYNLSEETSRLAKGCCVCSCMHANSKRCADASICTPPEVEHLRL